MARKKLKKSVLAEGEVTGHAHRLPATVDVYEGKDGVREFETEKPVTVTHEEHKPVTVPVGTFESARVQEYDHVGEKFRQVQD